MRESQLIYQDANWLIVTPRTEKAAQFWGRGTEWCTAWGDPRGLHPKRSCQFDEYNADGPLVVIINKQDPQERYQWHDASYQYMDRDDNDDTTMMKKLPQQAWAAVVPFVPELALKHMKNFTKEVQLAVVTHNGKAIRLIQNPSPEFQLAAVKQDGIVIEYIENPSREVQMAAVTQKGIAIVYINNPSPEVQLAAVKQDGNAIAYIKNALPEVQLAAVTQNGHAIWYINNPTPEVQLAAVMQDIGAIQWIKHPSPEVLAYVRQQGQNR